MAVCQSPSIKNVPTSSRASSLPQVRSRSCGRCKLRPLPQTLRARVNLCASRSPPGCNQYFSKVPAMPWLQVRLAISPEQAETYEDAFLEVGAVSVTFMDAEDQPIFEPELNTTPLWSHTHLLALFEADTDANA